MSGPTSRRLAPAKINLFLHVGPVDGQGFHPVASLMAFADVGDEVEITLTDPGHPPELRLDGAFAAELAATPAADNLVLRAATALLARAGRRSGGFQLRLTKRLPVAAGLGGGSSDAGAALRLVRDVLAPQLDESDLIAVAAELGSDGPACLHARPVVGTGRGEVLSPAPELPELHAVLINPRVPCPTGAVYRAYDAGQVAQAELPTLPPRFESAGHLAEMLARTRNDLEAPAARLVPSVAETLALVRALPQCRLGRLSGSGATVWALTDDARSAEALVAAVTRERPGWWVSPCRLGGPWT